MRVILRLRVPFHLDALLFENFRFYRRGVMRAARKPAIVIELRPRDVLEAESDLERDRR